MPASAASLPASAASTASAASAAAAPSPRVLGVRLVLARRLCHGDRIVRRLVVAHGGVRRVQVELPGEVLDRARQAGSLGARGLLPFLGRARLDLGVPQQLHRCPGEQFPTGVLARCVDLARGGLAGLHPYTRPRCGRPGRRRRRLRAGRRPLSSAIASRRHFGGAVNELVLGTPYCPRDDPTTGQHSRSGAEAAGETPYGRSVPLTELYAAPRGSS